MDDNAFNIKQNNIELLPIDPLEARNYVNRKPYIQVTLPETNLSLTINGQSVHKFSDMYPNDIYGTVIKFRQLLNREIIICKFRLDNFKRKDDSIRTRCKMLVIDIRTQESYVAYTDSTYVINILTNSNTRFPFSTTIVKSGKTYTFF